MKLVKMNHKVYCQILANRILSLCKNRGITVNKLAELSGIPHSTLVNLTNVRTFSPELKTLHKIANALGMTPAEFLDFEELSEFSFEE